ncbi:unnamed protein product [Cylicocyclus nassatus]|uniref:Uncharacterized protein n=1 Tax=Cylicocyclus nassatus TaxID=53992 RepID=A0AA36GTJ4_CYLNA|nr:unnamed protein product [Cylicocyclus nassatus]
MKRAAFQKKLMITWSEKKIGVEIKLYEKGVFVHRKLDEVTTDNNGSFTVSGTAKEFSKIDPQLNIYHRCNYKGPCYQKLTIKVPSKYISKGKQKTDCLSYVNEGRRTCFPIATWYMMATITAISKMGKKCDWSYHGGKITQEKPSNSRYTDSVDLCFITKTVCRFIVKMLFHKLLMLALLTCACAAPGSGRISVSISYNRFYKCMSQCLKEKHKQPNVLDSHSYDACYNKCIIEGNPSEEAVPKDQQNEDNEDENL